jgi:hypothetical protein
VILFVLVGCVVTLVALNSDPAYSDVFLFELNTQSFDALLLFFIEAFKLLELFL